MVGSWESDFRVARDPGVSAYRFTQADITLSISIGDGALIKLAQCLFIGGYN